MKKINDENRIKDLCDSKGLKDIFGQEIYDYSQLMLFDKGEMLCTQENPMQFLLFLVEGETKVYTTLENGKIYLLRIEDPISVYGDLELLTKKEYAANVEALHTCLVLGIPIEIIGKKYQNDPSFLQFIIRSLATRLDKVSAMSTSNLLLPLKSKVASFLLAHREEGSGLVSMRSTYGDVAEQLGATYRHLSRVMNEMVQEELIKKNGRNILIKDLETLRQLAGDTYRY